MNKQIKISISERCFKSYEYLRNHKINPNNYLREGGEKAVIDKANQYYIENKYKNAPNWLFD